MATEHRNLTGASLHEPKGCASAASGTVYISDGAGSGNWYFQNPHGSCYFSNVGSPSTWTNPGAGTYSKLDPTTVASGSSQDFTEATTARLTYTGTSSIHIKVAAMISMRQSSGAARDITLSVYKNGVQLAPSETMLTTTTAEWAHVTVFSDTTAVTNDYFEIYIKSSGTGNVDVASFRLSATGTL